MPVVNVRWDDANLFCRRLNKMTEIPSGLGIGKLPADYVFTLPTEAQWEYACRGGSSDRAWEHESELYEMAVCYERNKSETSWSAPKSVGSKGNPNALGLSDMLGNVEEWCLDVYAEYPDGSVTDPVGQLGDKGHVMRGGSYASSVAALTLGAHKCRAAFRDKLAGTSPRCGFRIAAVRSND